MRRPSRLIGSICGAAMLLIGWGAQPAEGAVSSAISQPFLLGTIEFQGEPQGEPRRGWYEFPDRVAETLKILSRCARSADDCPNSRVSEVLAEIAGLRGNDPFEVLAAINQLVNRRPYRSDQVNFNKSEHWASPLEFLESSGDCEDFAIFKYALLRHLGFPADSLRVVLLRRKTDGRGHAVLAVYLGDRVFILDSVTGLVRPQSEVTDYTAVFSFNEDWRWAHIAGSPAGRYSPRTVSEFRGPDRGDVMDRQADLDRSRSVKSGVFAEMFAAVFPSPVLAPNEFLVQLGVFRSLENANNLWQHLWRTQWDLLGGSKPQIRSVNGNAQAKLHVLQIGSLANARTAENLCADLMARGVDCFVVQPVARNSVRGHT